ncbi:MAG: hypothetical protein FWG34_09575 [Oscillospiraceae bacterium]|nr:hypothetical protein [Oscillospiraceae bacterium]
MNGRIYKYKINPEDYPEYERRAAPAVIRQALENRIQFTSLRAFPSKQAQNKPLLGQDANITQNNNMAEMSDMEEMIDMYVRHFKLGKVLWPVYPTLFAENFDELVGLCKRNGLFMFDFWGYVPGSHSSEKSIWGEYSIPPDADRIMRETLGNHFLGYDNGEQDGRYNSYAGQFMPLSDSRRAQYKNFQKYFEKLLGAMLNHTVTLSSLTYLHYFAKEGNSIMIGAETGQALPSSPMWFSFIRGAGKQYGLLWFGNASVWNRWGYKDYSVDSKEPDTSGGYEMGRFAGTSLGLLKRLIYNHYMYNCDILGFENCWLTEKSETGAEKDEKSYVINGKRNVLTPIGEIQKGCANFVESHPDPGVMYVPLAIVSDFFSGWVPPRHLYTSDIYKVWGNLPYNNGDYQLHALFGMLFPGYENAGFYRDERGFDPNTPFGEIADVLLSDVRGEILNRYQMAVILSSVELTLELYLKLKNYVGGGGRVIIFSDTVCRYAGLSKYDPDYPEFFGMKDLCLRNDGEHIAKPSDFATGEKTALKNNYQKGTVTVILGGDGLMVEKRDFGKENKINSDISRPCFFTPEVEKLLEREFGDLRIIGVNNKNLRYCVNIFKTGENDTNEYTLYVANSRFCEEHFDIVCYKGAAINAEMLEIPSGANECEEYLPLLRETENENGAKSGKYSIKPGDCQIWRVTVIKNPIDVFPESLPETQKKPLFLKIGPCVSAKDFLLNHPTFSHNFTGVMVEAEYLDKLDEEAAKKEAHYLKLQKVGLMVDISGMINHFPDFSLIGNIPERAEESIRKITEILDKACLYGAEAAIFSSQRNAENEYTQQQGEQGLEKSFEQIEKICDERGIAMYLQNRPNSLHNSGKIKELANRYALNTAYAQAEGYDCTKDLPYASILMLSSSMSDKFGQYYAVNKPVCSSDFKNELKSCFEIASKKNIPIIMSASYDCWDEVIYDLIFLNSIF